MFAGLVQSQDIKYRIKPEELYILNCEEGLGEAWGIFTAKSIEIRRF